MRLLMATAAHGDTARPVAERLDGAVAARSAHGTIASSLAISFASRVVVEEWLLSESACCGRKRGGVSFGHRRVNHKTRNRARRDKACTPCGIFHHIADSLVGTQMQPNRTFFSTFTRFMDFGIIFASKSCNLCDT
jgi:hypothetical protein